MRGDLVCFGCKYLEHYYYTQEIWTVNLKVI